MSFPVLTTDFDQNRALFLQAVDDLSVEKQTLSLGDKLDVTDVVVFGNPAAEKVVFLTSGTHGGEIPFGSAVQRAFLSAVRPTHPYLRNTLCVVGHAMNARGARLGLRTDTDGKISNIDAARNLMPFKEGERSALSPMFKRAARGLSLSKPFNRNVLFTPMVMGLVLYDGSLSALSKMPGFRNLFEHEHLDFRSQVIQGQNEDPALPFYGGTGEYCTAIQKLKFLADTYVRDQGVQSVHWIDVHTGNGKRGRPLVYLTVNPDSEKCIKQKLSTIVQDDEYADLSQFLSDPSVGDSIDQEFWGMQNINNIAVEYGTTKFPGPFADLDNLMGLMYEAQTLAKRSQGQCSDEEWAKMIAFNRELFTPSDPKWREQAVHFAQGFGGRLPALLGELAMCR